VARGRYLCRVLHTFVSPWFSSLSVHFCEQQRLTRTGSATGTDGCRSGMFRSATGTDGGCRPGQLAATWWHWAGNYSAFSTLSSTSCSLRVPFCAPPRNCSLFSSSRPFRVLLPVADLNRGLLGSKVLHCARTLFPTVILRLVFLRGHGNSSNILGSVHDSFAPAVAQGGPSRGFRSKGGNFKWRHPSMLFWKVHKCCPW
jgi:hypothetical protein